MNAIVTQNGLDPKIIESLVLGGDVGKLTPTQKLQYVAYRCKQVGLDPAAQPFQLLKLQGREVLYATAGATQQLCQTRGLSVQITKREKIEDIYCVEARVTDKDGRYSENMGSTPLTGLKGEALSNALLKATTKAIRRTVLAHCGLGVLDELEAETIPGAQMQRGNPIRQEYAQIADEIEACGDQEQLLAFWESPDVQDFMKRARDGAARGMVDYAGQAEERYMQRMDKIPLRKEDKRARIKSTDEYANGGHPSAEAPPLSQSHSAAEPSPVFELGETATRILDRIDVAENGSEMSMIAADAAKAKEGAELTGEEAAVIQKAYRAKARSMKQAA